MKKDFTSETVKERIDCQKLRPKPCMTSCIPGDLLNPTKEKYPPKYQLTSFVMKN